MESVSLSRLWLNVLLVVVSTGALMPVMGQQAHPASADQLETDAQRFDLSIEHRTRYENLENRFRLGETGSERQLPQRTRLRIGIGRVIAPFGFLVEFEDARVHLNDSGSPITNTMVDVGDILQLYVRLPLKISSRAKLVSQLYVGRQSFDLGSRRLLGRNRFRNTTNAFDGIRWVLDREKNWGLQAFLLQPVRRRLHQLDERDHGSYLWGAFLAGAPTPALKSEAYYFGLKESPASFPAHWRRFSTIGTRIYRDPQPASVSYEFEAALQFGKIGLLDHRAHFEHVSGDYTFDLPWRPMVTGRYDYASGDRDPSDDKSGTFDSLYGTRRSEWGPTGIYSAFYRSNISSPGWKLELNPSNKLLIVPAMRWLWLASARDQWVGSGLRDATAQSGAYLGCQFEVRVSYDFTKYLRSEIGYTRFWKGSYLEHVQAGSGVADSSYFFAETNLIFDHLFRR